MKLNILYKCRTHTITPIASVFINSHEPGVKYGENCKGIAQTELWSHHIPSLYYSYRTLGVREWVNIRNGKLRPTSYPSENGYNPRFCHPKFNKYEPSRIVFMHTPRYPISVAGSRYKRTFISACSDTIHLPYKDPKRPFIHAARFQWKPIAIESFAYSNPDHSPILGIGFVIPSFSWGYAKPKNKG